ncbi:PEP-CTERM sorting domain-containing protein [Rugamonas rivuli]|uniref:PEP-CTERM sorting domain-containing protein n=1 Tax=Rugamonas rivuli TaxID=2743358 RepID=A0A843SBB7_9BURK|nr:PEP-CTERM sorting domain-containing protein [Rugamonas rivuli]MQA21785.1 PEP-CTERM sorting domain-containing protein [Rugamonas rivuli]
MLNKVLCAGLLAASCMVAHAEQNWSFTFTGFYDQEADVFLPANQLSGTFSGTDLNGNGILELNELSRLHINGEYAADNFINCASTSYFACGTGSFSYRLGGKLDFDLGWHGWDDEGYLDTGHRIHTYDVDFAWDRHGPCCAGSTEQHLNWTAQTQQVVLGPVPEPAGYAMLGVGLLGLALRKRRRVNAAIASK